MAVTDVQGTSHGVITAVSSDNKTITLSQAQSGALFDTFNFAKPDVKSIAGYDPTGLTPIKTFTFSGVDQQNFALAFAQNVYVVMSTMSQTITPGTANASIPLLGNIIGGNVGPDFLPDQNDAIQSDHHQRNQVGIAGFLISPARVLKPLAMVSRSGSEDRRPELQRLQSGPVHLVHPPKTGALRLRFWPR